jgi:predicted RecA/RadA family phage recombinase
MAKNYIQCGDVINYQNSGSAITSGSVVKIGSLMGIAMTDIAATTGVGAVAIEGVFGPVAKETGQAWVQGDQLYWDAGNSRFTKTSTSNTAAGHAFEPAASGDTTGYIRLLPKSA